MTYFEISYTIHNAETDDYSKILYKLNQLPIFSKVNTFNQHQTLARVSCPENTQLLAVKEALQKAFKTFDKPIYFHISESLYNKYSDFHI